MAALAVECLRCGAQHELARARSGLQGGECPRCGYVGWAAATGMTEGVRRALRDHPVGERAGAAVPQPSKVRAA